MDLRKLVYFFFGELMSEFNDLFSDEFFIIDSKNIDSVKDDKLYGFILSNGKVIENNFNDLELNGEGAYVLIKNNIDAISIHQDFNGSFGLYVYNTDNYFAISNSFLKLVEFLKKNHKLTLNNDYSKLLMSCGLCSIIFKETLINEIKCIPRNYVVNINKISKKLDYEELDYKEHTISLNSEEGLVILDNWFNKWVTIIRFLKNKTNNIQVDLSGGFDSRIIAALWLCANIDLNKIYIRSFNDSVHCHEEDYRIASEIAKEFNFPLNNMNALSVKNISFEDIHTVLNMSFYVKLGFHNQLNYRFGRTDKPIYVIGGVAGETIRESRSYGGKTPDELKEELAKKSRRMDKSFYIPSKNIIQSTLDELASEFNIEDKNSKDISNLLYPEVRCRNHFGKLLIEEYFSNKILLTPALDPEIHKLKVSTEECEDNYLLMALILVRYCPKLLDFDIEGDREFNEETIEYAKKLNSKYPFNSKKFNFISGPKIKHINNKNWKFNWQCTDNYLQDIFNSKKFELEFEKYFSHRLYNKISRSMDKKDYFKVERAIPAFSVLKIINDVKFSNKESNNDFDIDDWFESFNNYTFEDNIKIKLMIFKHKLRKNKRFNKIWKKLSFIKKIIKL